MTHRPTPSSAGSRSVWFIVGVHLVAAAATMAGLFLTVHHRDVRSSEFQRRWVDTGVYQDRWSDLYRHWGADGYWSNGGLWCVNEDRPFRRWVESGNLNWFDPATFDPSVPHYYRSNTALFAAPIGLLDRTITKFVGVGHDRQVMVAGTQGLVAITAVLTGLLAHRLARSWGADRRSALTLGLCAQIVVQTSPMMLASYWRYYPTHAFAAALSLFMLALALPACRDRMANWLAGAGAFAMVAADVPHAVVAIAAWALVTWLGGGTLANAGIRPRWIPVGIGTAAAVGVIAAQFLVALAHHPDARFVGSGLLFRTGLDGDRSMQDGILDGVRKLFEGPVMFGGPGVETDAGISPITWTILLAAPPLALVLAAVRRLPLPVVPLSIGAGAFAGYVVAFSNAVAIHPYVYPTLIVGPGAAAMFGVLPAAVGRNSIGRWIVAIAASLLAALLAMNGLRSFAVQFPLAAA